MVRTECDYFAPVSFPDAVDVGVAVERLGRSSVTYRVAVFVRGSADAARAAGRFTHVYVDRQDRRPRALPDDWRTALRALVVEAPPTA